MIRFFSVSLVLVVVFGSVVGCGEEGLPLEPGSVEESSEIAMIEVPKNLRIEMDLPEPIAEKLIAAKTDRAKLAPASDGSGVFAASSIEEASIAAAGNGYMSYIYVIIASGGHDTKWLYLEIDSSSNTATGTANVPTGTAILQAFYVQDGEISYQSGKETLEVEQGVHYIVTLAMKQIANGGKLDVTVTWEEDSETFTSEVEVDL